MSGEWRPVVGFEGVYEVSDTGDVRRAETGRVLHQYTNSSGHKQLSLCNKSKRGVYRVHRLVAFAFLGPGGDGLEVCHNDGDHTNNRVENLRWDTHRENMRDMVRHGAQHLQPKAVCRKGLHPMTEENTIRNTGKSSRLCGECNRAKQRAAYAAKKRKDEGA